MITMLQCERGNYVLSFFFLLCNPRRPPWRAPRHYQAKGTEQQKHRRWLWNTDQLIRRVNHKIARRVPPIMSCGIDSGLPVLIGQRELPSPMRIQIAPNARSPANITCSRRDRPARIAHFTSDTLEDRCQRPRSVGADSAGVIDDLFIEDLRSFGSLNRARRNLMRIVSNSGGLSKS